jgi:hypothetical protein
MNADRSKQLCLVVALWVAAMNAAQAASRTLHVSPTSLAPAPPYTNWATAAHTIQDAVDAAQAGDTVLVTNGLYATGGRVAVGTLTNRVVIDKPIVVQSVNGPAVTIIEGWQVPGIVTGSNAIRCVYMTNGASLSGFTVTNGATAWVANWWEEDDRFGGGVLCAGDELVSNCVVTGNAAFEGGGMFGGTVNHSTLSNNSAWQSGGAGDSTLNDCVLAGNEVENEGGGAGWSTLNRCTLINNHAHDPEEPDDEGGGASGCTLNDCVLSDNSASTGGGASDSILNRCILSGNRAGWGGGANGGLLVNCLLTANAATSEGGGARRSALINCTITGNSAGFSGGGLYAGTATNCIIFFNRARSGTNYGSSSLDPITLDYCCTTPRPPTGRGHLTNEPAFMNPGEGDFRLRTNSPCIDAGANLTGITHDLAGDRRPSDGNGDGSAIFDMGAYEHAPRFVIRTITRAGRQLTIQWAAAPSLKLQRTPSLTNPHWTDVPGSLGQGAATLPLGNGDEFFRLVRP